MIGALTPTSQCAFLTASLSANSKGRERTDRDSRTMARGKYKKAMMPRIQEHMEGDRHKNSCCKRVKNNGNCHWQEEIQDQKPQYGESKNVWRETDVRNLWWESQEQ